MKNKYERLSKEEKKQAQKDFMEFSEFNKNIYKKIKRLCHLSTAGIVYAILSFILDFYLTNSIFDFILDGLLLIFCLLFILKSSSILNNQINKYLINESKNKVDKKVTKKNKKNKV